MWVIVIKEKSLGPLGEAVEKREKNRCEQTTPTLLFSSHYTRFLCIGKRNDQQRRKWQQFPKWMLLLSRQLSLISVNSRLAIPTFIDFLFCLALKKKTMFHVGVSSFAMSCSNRPRGN